MSTTIQIQDTATIMINGVKTAVLDREKANRAAAEGALPVVQRNFQTLAGTNVNRFGVRGGFWNRMLAGTRAGGDAAAGFVAMPREVALRFFGGTVFPQKGKYLAIPARAEAYGKSPRVFNDLRFIPFRSGARALVQREQTVLKFGRKRKDGSRKVSGRQTGGGVFFWLVPSATIQANRDVIPTDEEMKAGALRGLATYAKTATRRAA